jgi:hypothetical protein
MSKTLYVNFRDQGFWAFDVVSGIFLKHLIDVAEKRIAERDEGWLSSAVRHWRFDAICSDCGLFLDDNWTGEQIQSVRELTTAACDLLSQRREISAEEMSSWSLLDGKGVFPRGYTTITTASAGRSFSFSIACSPKPRRARGGSSERKTLRRLLKSDRKTQIRLAAL